MSFVRDVHEGTCDHRSLFSGCKTAFLRRVHRSHQRRPRQLHRPLEIGSTCQPTCDTGYTLFGERSCVDGTTVDAADCLLPGQPAANPTTLKLAVDACLDAVPSGEKCCSTDPGCDDPATARCRGAGCVDLPDWDVSRVTDMTELFEDRTEFNQDISRWSTSSVTSFRGDVP